MKVQAWAKSMDMLTNWTNQYQTQDHIVHDGQPELRFQDGFQLDTPDGWATDCAKGDSGLGSCAGLDGLVPNEAVQHERVKCHILVLSHISYQGGGDSGC